MSVSIKRASAKNQLQELCHSIGFELPTYSHVGHKKDGWSSTVTISNLPDVKFESTGKSKKSADSAVAQMMIEHISGHTSEHISNNHSKKSSALEDTKREISPIPATEYQLPEFTKHEKGSIPCDVLLCLLVDLENCNRLDRIDQQWEQLSLSAPSAMQLFRLTVASFCHPKSSLSDVVINSAVSDAADHFITYVIGQICVICKQLDIKPHIIIHTRDHFASAVSMFMPNHVTVSHCPQPNGVIEELHKYMQD